jgi:hypothetical protein
MKITAIRTQAIEIPFKEPIGTSIHNIAGVAGLLVWIETDEGIIGRELPLGNREAQGTCIGGDD